MGFHAITWQFVGQFCSFDHQVHIRETPFKFDDGQIPHILSDVPNEIAVFRLVVGLDVSVSHIVMAKGHVIT